MSFGTDLVDCVDIDVLYFRRVNAYGNICAIKVIAEVGGLHITSFEILELQNLIIASIR